MHSRLQRIHRICYVCYATHYTLMTFMSMCDTWYNLYVQDDGRKHSNGGFPCLCNTRSCIRIKVIFTLDEYYLNCRDARRIMNFKNGMEESFWRAPANLHDREGIPKRAKQGYFGNIHAWRQNFFGLCWPIDFTSYLTHSNAGQKSAEGRFLSKWVYKFCPSQKLVHLSGYSPLKSHRGWSTSQKYVQNPLVSSRTFFVC